MDAGQDDELAHVEHEGEAPAVEALQDAFEPEPMPQSESEPEPMSEPEPEPQPMPEPEPQPRIDPAVDDERAHVENEGEAPAVEAVQEAFEPRVEREPEPPTRPSITGRDAVGFNLFREQPATSAPPPPSTAGDEEAVLWFGEEFGAAELEASGAGWRAGERPGDEPSEDDIVRLASNEGWSDEEIAAMRAYLTADAAGTADDPAAAPAAGDAARPPDAAAPLPLDQDWLRGRRGPAATAYRRLRRIFQG